MQFVRELLLKFAAACILRRACWFGTGGVHVRGRRVRYGQVVGLFVCAVIASAVGCRQSGNTAEHGVVLLRYNPGAKARSNARRGFSTRLAKEFPSVRVLSSDQYAGTTPESALDKATDVLNKYQDRVSGIFAVCEPNANGVLRALENTGLVGKVKCVVFDPGSGLIDGMAQGKVDGIVLQDPVKMGYEGVKTMVAHLDGTDG